MVAVEAVKSSTASTTVTAGEHSGPASVAEAADARKTLFLCATNVPAVAAIAPSRPAVS